MPYFHDITGPFILSSLEFSRNSPSLKLNATDPYSQKQNPLACSSWTTAPIVRDKSTLSTKN